MQIEKTEDSMELLAAGLLGTPETNPSSSIRWSVARILLQHASPLVRVDVFLSVLKIKCLTTAEPPLMVGSVLESLLVVLKGDNNTTYGHNLYSSLWTLIYPALHAARRSHRTLAVRALSESFCLCHKKSTADSKLTEMFTQRLLDSCRDSTWQVRLEAVSALERVFADQPHLQVRAI
jgi:hypothetical protein